MNHLRLLFVACVLLSVANLGCGTNEPTTSPVASFDEQIAQARSETESEARAKQLIRIGYQQWKAHDVAGADNTLQIAWKECELVPDATAKAGAWYLMADAQVALGNRSLAQQAAQAAASAAQRIAPAESKVAMLARVAQSQATADSAEAAAATLKSAEDLVPKIPEVQSKIAALAAIAKAYHKLDQQALRDRRFAEAFDLASAVADPKQRCLALAEVAARQASFNEAAARKTFDLSLESANKIPEAYPRVYALGQLGQKLAEAHLDAQAQRIFNEAEQLSSQIPQPDLQLHTLEHIRSLRKQAASE